MNKSSNRTLLTQQNICDAFWKLYIREPMSKITVKEICELAGYNRGTFYHYFQDVYDVLERIETEILNQFNMRFRKIARVSSHLQLFDLVKYTFAPCRVYNKYLAVMLGENGDPAFQKKLRENTKSALRDQLILKYGSLGPNAEYYLEFCVSGLLSCTRMWYEQGNTDELNDFISMMLDIISNPLGFVPAQPEDRDRSRTPGSKSQR